MAVHAYTHRGQEGEQTANSRTLWAATNEYLRQRRARGEIRPKTFESYRTRLHIFARALGRDTPVDQVKRRHVERWLEEMPVGPTTKRQAISIVRRFFRWAMVNRMVRTDPTLGIESPKEPRRRPRSMQQAAVAQSLAGAPDLRARVVMLLCVQECLRIGEVAALQLDDVDFERRTVFVQEGKGGADRRVPLSDETAEAIRAYLQTVPPCAGPLIRSHKDPYRGLTSSYLSHQVGVWMRRCGVTGSAHPLRHTGATDMADAGADLRAIQEILGHASLATTQKYTGRVKLDKQREAMGPRRYGGPDPDPK